MPCGPFCDVEAQRNLSSCHLQTHTPPRVFSQPTSGLRVSDTALAQRPCVGASVAVMYGPYLSAALGFRNHSLIVRSFILQTSVEGLHCLCGQNCRFLECAVAEQPREYSRQCPTWRDSLPEQRERMDSGNSLEASAPPPPSTSVLFRNQKCPCASLQTFYAHVHSHTAASTT